MQEYEMTEGDMTALLSHMKYFQIIMPQCGEGQTRQEKANEAWKRLGAKMGFDGMTVKPHENGNPRCFRANPVTKEDQDHA